MVKKLKYRFCVKNCLFGSVRLTKNAEVHKYKYSGYGIGFNSCSKFLFTDGNMGKMSFFLELKIKIS